ncbi:MAG: 2-iminoacetate synthase ThiH [bacterium]|nr:2-iminoacetate synthase ThiH [bacterium]
MSGFNKIINTDFINSLLKISSSTNKEMVSDLLKKEQWNLSDFPALISPAASEYIEELARISHNITKQRFGNTMQMYIPLYISNFCDNTCLYCGFNVQNTTKRKRLSKEEILKEAVHINEKGFKHILILTGESNEKADSNYIREAIKIIKPHFSSISLEIQPLSTDKYAGLIKEGADSLTIYQETYHKKTYEKYHLSGKKKSFNNRIASTDYAGQAGFYRINIGALLGLYDWRFEALALAHHLNYLIKKYWKIKFSVSLPRIQKISTSFNVPFKVTDLDITQFICAFRLVFPDTGITLSTREPAELRNSLIKIGVTTLSAESHTSPGTYSGQVNNGKEQFSVSDHRRLEQINACLIQNGYDMVMKDWDRSFQS